MPLNIDPQQILLHIFNLVLLFGILYVLLYKPVHDFMEKREEEYRQRDRDTKEALDKADQLKAEYEDRIKKAEKEMAEARAEAGARAEEAREKIISDAHLRADDIVNEAREKARKEHDRLMARAQTEIAEYVSKAAEKVVMEEGSLTDDFDAFFDGVQSRKDDGNG